MSPTTTNFQWKPGIPLVFQALISLPTIETPEYDALLEKIASTDDVEGSDWNELRRIIRHRLEQNVNLFLSTSSGAPAPLPFNPQPSTAGGQRLPPFPAKELSQLHLYNPPVSYMNGEQAKEFKEAVFSQLDQFEDKPPFTIQRLCELLLEPKKHYKSVGKYLRAVEKSILVTSTHDAFPIVPGSDQPSIGANFPTTSEQPLAPINGNGATFRTVFPGSSTSVPSSPAFATRRSLTPSTPLFSPIPFLHADARSRSKSRSPPPATPPMTPLTLSEDLPPLGDDERVIGMVDEMDDPGPGHLSDKPKPLTVAGGAKPFLESLSDRFVKSEQTEGGEEVQGGVVVKDGGEGQPIGVAVGSRKKIKVEDGSDEMADESDRTPGEEGTKLDKRGIGAAEMDLDVTEGNPSAESS